MLVSTHILLNAKKAKGALRKSSLLHYWLNFHDGADDFSSPAVVEVGEQDKLLANIGLNMLLWIVSIVKV